MRKKTNVNIYVEEKCIYNDIFFKEIIYMYKHTNMLNDGFNKGNRIISLEEFKKQNRLISFDIYKKPSIIRYHMITSYGAQWDGNIPYEEVKFLLRELKLKYLGI